MRISDLLKAHILIGGQTRSGKTHFANYLALKTKRAIFVNPQHEQKPKKFFTTSTITAKTLLEHRYINFEIVNLDDIKKVIKYSLALGKNGIPLRVFIDEAHLFERYVEIELIPRMGGKWNVYQITISQRLNDVASKHKAVITQARYVVLFSLSRFELGLLRYYGLQDVREKLPPHHFVIFDTATEEIKKFKPIKARF